MQILKAVVLELCNKGKKMKHFTIVTTLVLIFLFQGFNVAGAGTYIYYNEKGERILHLPKTRAKKQTAETGSSGKAPILKPSGTNDDEPRSTHDDNNETTGQMRSNEIRR